MGVLGGSNKEGKLLQHETEQISGDFASGAVFSSLSCAAEFKSQLSTL